MWVKVRGGSGACSAVAETRSPSTGWRFFCRIETTSTLVQAQSAASTASIGLGPCACDESASKKIEFPFAVVPSKMLPPCHSLCAIIGAPLERLFRS